MDLYAGMFETTFYNTHKVFLYEFI